MKRQRKAHKNGQNFDVENQAESDGNEDYEIDKRENQEGAETTEENKSVFDNILDFFKSPFIEEECFS